MSQKTLLIRLDRMGDLILNLPVDSVPPLEGEEVHWAINKNFSFLLKNRKKVLPFYGVDLDRPRFWEFFRYLKDLKPDQALVFYAPWWVTLALFLARVPLRAGRLSQWHSFLFFNKGIRQKRSLAEKHESAYNIELLYKGLYPQLQEPNPSALQLEVPPADLSSIQLPKRYIVIHPGMGGSALNWPTENYTDFTNQISKDIDIIITGTKIDRPFTLPLKQKLEHSTTDQTKIHWLNEKLNISQLMHVLSQAEFVLAPSTGVIHLAASLGAPVLGIYSPIQSERAKRWSPQGPEVHIFEANDKDTTMTSISTQQVISTASQILQRKH